MSFNKFKFYLNVVTIVFVSSLNAQNPSLEFASGAGNPSGTGPTTSNQIITLQNNTNNPSGNTFATYTPNKNVTFSITNHQRTMSAFPNVGLMFGGTVTTNSAVPSAFSSFPTISGIGSSTNSHYTSTNSNSGTGIEVAANNSVAFYASLYPLFESGNPLPTPGNPVKLQYADLVITFNTPTSNPILHFTGVGGGIGDLSDPNNIVIGYSPEFELVTPGLSFTRLSGSSELTVPNATEILNNASFPFGITEQGAMSGSVMVNGTNITTITLRVYLKVVDHPNATLPYWSNAAGNRIQSGDVFLIGISTSIDTDFDGIPDTTDLDDDNDGILDSEECSTYSTINNTVYSENFNSYAYETQVGQSVTNGSAYYNSPNPPTGGRNGLVNGVWEITGSNTPIGSTANGNFLMYWTEGGGPAITVNDKKVYGINQNVTPNTNYNFSFRVGNLSIDSPAQLRVLANGIEVVPQFTVTNSWQTISYSWNSGNNTTVNFEIYNENLNTGGNDFALDDITVTGAIQVCTTDTDGDGIINSLDLDSDNDGCSDANEYYNSNTFDSDQDGIYGTGTPSIDANGLVIGASYTGNTSNVISIGVNSTISSNPIDQSLLQGGNVTFNASIINGSGTTTIQWEESTNGGATWTLITNGGNYSGANTTSLNINNVNGTMDNYSYRLAVSQSNFVCGPIYSGVAQIIILEDNDNDLVADIYDLDDDNDGILDTSEMQTCASGGFLSLTGYSGKLWDILEDDSWNLFNNSSGFPENLTLKGTFNYHINQNTQQSLDVNFYNYQLSNFNSYSEFTNFNGQNIPTGTSDAAIEFTKIISNEEEGIYNINVNLHDNFLFIYINNTVVYKGNYFATPNPFILNKGDIIKIVVVEDHELNTSLDLNFIKISSLNSNPSLCFTDTDNDGISNHLDTDSDNDGCSDANEYYNSNTFDSDQDGIYGTGTLSIDANGLVIGASYTGNTSNVISIGVNSTISSNPIDQSLLPGGNVTFNASIINGSGTTTIQWEESTNGGATWTLLTNGGNYSGANTTSLNINNVDGTMDNYSYRLAVSQSNFVCGPIYSGVAQIIILEDNDNDLIADTIDLDDDNDGIYDIEECDVSLNSNSFNLFAPLNFGSTTNDIWNINVSGNSGTLVQFNNQNYTIPASGVLVVSLNGAETPDLQENIVESGKSLTLTANQPVTVLHELAGGAVSDSWVVLPQSLWGTQYRLFSYTFPSNAQNNQYAMIYSATNNNIITISNKLGVVQKTITLNEGETYLQAGLALDMTGWTVSSTEKISIIVGVRCANGSAGFCDNIDEMLLPINQLGTKFYIPNGANNTTYVMAEQANTVITINNVVTATLSNPGDVYSFPVLATELKIVETNKPATVWQLMPNNTDPSWLLVLDSQKAVTSFNFATPSSMVNSNIISLIVPTSNTAQIRLNGNPVSGWISYPTEPFMSYAEISGFPASTSINVNSTTGNIPILSSYTGSGSATTNSTVPSMGNLDVANGIQVLYNCADTDGDGIADYLDLDSDGDGCSDANEYYNNSNADGGDNGVYGLGNPTVNPNGTVQGAIYSGNYTNTVQIGTLSSVVTQPINQETLTGGTIIFSASILQGSGNTTYQWQQSINNGSTWTNIVDNTTFAGVQTENLTVFNVPLSMNGYLYRLVISESNFICNQTFSLAAQIEILIDFDGDSVADKYDLDDDNDGVLDSVEGTTDFDGDGFPNHQDLDSDNDGCSDAYEAGTTSNSNINYQFDTNPALNSVNGFFDALETALDNGIYIGSYTYNYSINNSLNACCPQTAPTLSSTNQIISCTIGSIDLNTLVTSSLPPSSVLLWFDNPSHIGSALTMPITNAGTYYAFYQNTINNCFGPASLGVTVQFTTIPQGVPNFTTSLSGSIGTISNALNNGTNISCGGVSAWINTNALSTSNNAYATIELGENQISNCMTFQNISLSIPNNTIISGIELRIERSKTGDYNIKDEIIQLIDGNNNLIGSNKAKTINWPSTDAVSTYGGTNDNWNALLTANDINTGNFGFRLSVASDEGIDNGIVTAKIDRIQMFIHYVQIPQVCNDNENATFTISGVTNATSYNWSIPSGVSIVSGQGTNSVVLSFSSTTPIGINQICATPENECGSGIQNCLPIYVNDCFVPQHVLQNDSFSTTYGTLIMMNIYANDSFIPTIGTISFSSTSNGILTTFNSGTITNPSDDTFSYIPNLGFYGNDIISYTVCDANIPQYCDTKTITIYVAPREFYLKALLQGSLFGETNGIMRDELRIKNLIPLTEPYTAKMNAGNLRFSRPDYTTSETTNLSVLGENGNNSIVDWVFIELRDPTNRTIVLHTQAALIQKDGDIVDATDGISPLKFRNLTRTSYFVAIKHRNHLGVMSNIPLLFSNQIITFDFSGANANLLWNSTSLYNGFEQILDTSGKYALWAGNSSCDNKIKYFSVQNDQINLFNEVITHSNNLGNNYNFDDAINIYKDGDINMDGKIKYRGPSNDSSFIFYNLINKYLLNSIHIYNYDIFVEQIPQ